MLGAQFQLRGAAFGAAKIKITTHKKDETLGACRRGLLSANQKGKRCVATITLGLSHLATMGAEQDARADIVHSSTEATMDIPTSAGLVRITTTITTTDHDHRGGRRARRSERRQRHLATRHAVDVAVADQAAEALSSSGMLAPNAEIAERATDDNVDLLFWRPVLVAWQVRFLPPAGSDRP